MDCGIDTIRFVVMREGFLTWLKKKGLRLEAYSSSGYRSNNLDSKVKSGKFHFVGVVHFNKNGVQSLVETIVVTMSNAMAQASNYKLYTLEVAGLHQPHKKNIKTSTYDIISELIKKYKIVDVDAAFDFESFESIGKKSVVAVSGASSSKVKSSYGTYYYRATVGDRDVKIYNKSQKALEGGYELEGYGKGLQWLRLEVALQLPLISRSKGMEGKVKGYNNLFLKLVASLCKEGSFELEEFIDALSVGVNNTINYNFFDMQIAKMMDMRAKMPSL